MDAIRTQLAIASTCKRLRTDFLCFLFPKYIFEILSETDDLMETNHFLQIIGPAKRYALRHLYITLGLTRSCSHIYITQTMKFADFLAHKNPKVLYFKARPKIQRPVPGSPSDPVERSEGPKLLEGSVAVKETVSVTDILRKYCNDFHPDLKIRISYRT
ncbi:MAG: hypothetical protein M1821_002269 [Bathelium mastoideum]|nr:MAG: hypothetical protein M1821_002269 [Bathelium mastoideum]